METITQESVERRKNKRFRVQEGVFAVLGAKSGRMGQIVDISQGGIAFHHKNGDTYNGETAELSILFDDESNTVGYGPLKFQAVIVSEVPIRHTGGTAWHRCCLQFTDLTYYQRSWLNDCIQNLTVVDKGVAPADTKKKILEQTVSEGE